MKNMKITKLFLTSAMLGSLLAPTIAVSANSNNQNSSDNSSMQSSVNYDFGTTHSLSLKQQNEFNEIKNSNVFTQDQLNEIMNDREQNNNPDRISFASAKNLILKAAKYTGKHFAKPVIKGMIETLTKYKDKEQDGLQYVLVKYAHFNKTVAYWVARAIVFTQG